MGFTKKAVITDAGIALLGRLHTGDTLQIARAVMGEGDIGSVRPGSMTEVSAPVMDVPVARVSKPIDGKVTVRFDATRAEDIPRDFYWREFGIYALDVATGDEVLYIYNNTTTPDYIATSGAGLKSVKVTIKIGDASDLSMEVDLSVAYATTEEFDAHLADRENPHVVTAEQIGALPIDGNAVSATKLANARKIGNANFDGTTDVTLAQMGALPSANIAGGSSPLNIPTLAAGASTQIDVSFGVTLPSKPKSVVHSWAMRGGHVYNAAIVENSATTTGFKIEITNITAASLSARTLYMCWQALA